MLIWSGFGSLAFVFAFVGAVGGSMLMEGTGGLGFGLSQETGIALGLLAAAVVNWVVGVRLNSRPGRQMVDVQSGKRVVLRRQHRLFWVPMQYWSAVMIVLAALTVVTSMNAPRPGGGPGAIPQRT